MRDEPGRESPDLLEEPPGELVLETLGQPSVERRAVEIEPDGDRARRRIGDEAGPERGEGPAAAEGDLESPDDPAAIARLDSARRDRVQLAEPPEQLRETTGLAGPVIELGRLLGETAGDLETVHDRPVVEARASDKQRHVPTGVDAVKYPARLGLKRSDRELLGRIDDVDEMPGRDLLLSRRWFRGAYVEAPVHRYRVHRHQLEVVRGHPGQFEPKCRLTGAGRANDHDTRRIRAWEVFQSASSTGR